MLPGAVLAGLVGNILLHFILYATLKNFITPYPDLPEKTLRPFVFALAYLWYGSRIAPNNRLTVGITLFGILMFLTGGFWMAALTGGKWFGNELYMEAGGIATALGVFGALLGIFLIKKSEIRSHLVAKGDESANSSEFKANEEKKSVFSFREYSTEISNLILIGLFILCVYLPGFRKIFFSVWALYILFNVILSIKEKLYNSPKRKILLARDVLFFIALMVGIMNKEFGFYFSVACVFLCSFDFIRQMICARKAGEKKSS